MFAAAVSGKGPGEQGINQPIQAAEGKLHLGDPGGLEAEKLESQSWLPCVLCDAALHAPILVSHRVACHMS